MTGISAMGRIIGEQVVNSSAGFGDGLAASIARQGSGGWAPGPLWDAAILSMRTQAGGLAQNLENLKTLGDDVFSQLSPEVQSQLDDQLRAVKLKLDEIHTDQGGEFAGHLTEFQTFGDKVASEITELLRKADEANATGATTAVKGAQVLDWSIADDVGKETVTVTEQAATNVQTAAAGGRSGPTP